MGKAALNQPARHGYDALKWTPYGGPLGAEVKVEATPF
jgi:hypothetical protein